MAIAKPRVSMPETAPKGEVIVIKTLVTHPMETGRRKGADGNMVPKNIIQRFEAKFNGKDFLTVDIAPGTSPNPYFEFPFKVTEAGEFTFTWIEDTGEKATETKKIAVG